MYNVASRFHTLAIADSPKTRCRIYFISDAVNCWDDNDVQTNGTLLVGAAGDTDSNGRIGQGGVTVTEIFNKDKNITLGGTVSYQIGMTLVNSDGALNNFAFGRCKVYLDVYDDANSVWLPCPLGVFRIELPVKRKVQLITATGYDQMQVLNAIADTWWNGLNFTGGLTIANILNSMVTQLGLHLSATSSTNMVNTTLSFTTPPIDSVERTYRDILGWIAEATGTVAHFNRDGELDMRPYLTPQIGGNNIVIDTDTTGNQCLSIDVAEYSVSQIDALTIKLTTSDQGVTVGSGTNVYTIMDNPFLYGPDVATIQGKLTPIYNRLSAYATYSPISTRLIYDWSIEAGDIIYITNNSTTYNMPIFQQKMVWRGGYVTSELMSSGDTVRPQVSSGERETYRYNVEMATKVGDNEIISKINQTAEQIQIQASKVNLTGYITATNLATAGQTVINGGNITTGSISADRISGGTLTVGGMNNANGVIQIKNADNVYVGYIDNDCYQLINPSLGTMAARLGMYQNTYAAYLFLYNQNGIMTTELSGAYGRLYLRNPNGANTVYLDAEYGNIRAGDGTRDRIVLYGTNGNIVLYDANGTSQVQLTPNGHSQFLKPIDTYGGLNANNGLTADNATVNGVLDVTQRRCYATLSSPGWYRVMNVNAGNANVSKFSVGTIIDINIGTEFWNSSNMTHKISLHGIFNNPAFVGEESRTNYLLLINKVRYTYDTSGNGHIDIYYTGTSENSVWCSFTVHTPYIYQHWFVAENFTSVAPSPSNETVLPEYEYTFAANTYYHDDGVTSGVRHVVDRRGDIVTVTIESAGSGVNCPVGQYTTVYTLPSELSPSAAVYTVVDAYGANNIISGMIDTTGRIRLYPVLSSTNYYRFTVTYTLY